MYCIECGKELGIYEFDKCIFCRESDNMNAWKVVMLIETLKEEIKKLIEEKACTSSITEKQRLLMFSLGIILIMLLKTSKKEMPALYCLKNEL